MCPLSLVSAPMCFPDEPPGPEACPSPRNLGLPALSPSQSRVAVFHRLNLNFVVRGGPVILGLHPYTLWQGPVTDPTIQPVDITDPSSPYSSPSQDRHFATFPSLLVNEKIMKNGRIPSVDQLYQLYSTIQTPNICRSCSNLLITKIVRQMYKGRNKGH